MEHRRPLLAAPTNRRRFRDRAEAGRALGAAAPAASRQACRGLARAADECACVLQPEPFDAVGSSYEDFRQTHDAEVIECLERRAAHRPANVAERSLDRTQGASDS